jgi:hypothetical protein
MRPGVRTVVSAADTAPDSHVHDATGVHGRSYPHPPTDEPAALTPGWTLRWTHPPCPCLSICVSTQDDPASSSWMAPCVHPPHAGTQQSSGQVLSSGHRSAARRRRPAAPCRPKASVAGHAERPGTIIGALSNLVSSQDAHRRAVTAAPLPSPAQPAGPAASAARSSGPVATDAARGRRGGRRPASAPPWPGRPRAGRSAQPPPPPRQVQRGLVDAQPLGRALHPNLDRQLQRLGGRRPVPGHSRWRTRAGGGVGSPIAEAGHSF